MTRNVGQRDAWQRAGLATTTLAWAIYAVLAPTGDASAQIAFTAPVSDFYDWEYDLRFSTEYQFNADLKQGRSFDSLRFEGGLGGGGPMSQNVRVFMDFDYTHTSYDFQGPPVPTCADIIACAVADPWQNVHRIDIAPGASLALNEAFHIVAAVPMRWNFESDAGESGFTGGGILALRLAPTESFVTTIGIGVTSELEDSARVFAVVSVDWQLLDGLRLVTRGRAYEGGEAVLLWGPSETFQLSLSGGYEWRRFRLTSRSINPNGVGQYTSVPLLAGIKLNIQERADIAFEGGIAVAGRLEVDDSRGRALRRESFGTTGLLRGSFRFSW